ncbi:TMEM165/GDT1 family protein [Nocardia cyriacigeorgica]|uniref:GDT1 family protein n=1 Tax=Nocardia cyriacigeorgica TaxID=135487 RepID=A0A6P1D1J7_9NOCA|nr:TMEM165/GDT1 family protein [Nocardia cyriacigeorgica]NEW38307.1 TMEM165/GDT1 family protein [Nocardia cyriacigeorgica]NEW44346.1 TMEM165/GDT1 family protein [Nocardia cyriacigeorgica]
MIATVLLSVGIVFLAELGDKSQLMALTFALRYRWWVVLGGIATATAAVHVISVAVGHFLGAALPTTAIALVAALTFLAVGIWTLREHVDPDDEEAPKVSRLATAAPFFVVLSAFLLAELGDRTMFATAALATDYDWAGVWLGSTIGMVAADALAIAVGILVGKHLPERAIGIGSGLLFLFFGSLTLTGTVWPNLGTLPGAAVAVVVPLIAGAVMYALIRRRAEVTAQGDPADFRVQPADEVR